MGREQKVGLRAKLQTILSRTAAVAGLLLVCAGTASAGNFCATFNSIPFVGIGMSIPGKGKCKTGAFISSSFPGFVGTGSLCTSSDNTTVLLNLADGFVGVPEALVGSFDRSSLTGSGNDCVPTTCTPFTIAVAKCNPAKQPIPAVSGDSQSNSGSSTTLH